MLFDILHPESHDVPRPGIAISRLVPILKRRGRFIVQQAHFSHFHDFDFGVLQDKLLDIHETAANPNEQSPINHFSNDLLRSKHVLIFPEALDFEWKAGLIDELCEFLINVVICDGFVDLHLILVTFIKLEERILLIQLVAKRM